MNTATQTLLALRLAKAAGERTPAAFAEFQAVLDGLWILSSITDAEARDWRGRAEYLRPDTWDLVRRPIREWVR